MKPIAIFAPFGSDAPRIALFGKNSGNWNSSCFQEGSTYKSSPGLYFRFNSIAQPFGIEHIIIPSPADCNTIIGLKGDFATQIRKEVTEVSIWREAKLDGIVLPSYSYSGAIASADCPTIVAYCPTMKRIIMAHAGLKSLIDIRHVLKGEAPRENQSVVDSIMEKTRAYAFTSVEVFITCGISGLNYTYPELVPFVKSRFGEACATGESLNLQKIIAQQFLAYGVRGVLTDTVDTFGDTDDQGEFLWHSYRRGKTPEEKSERNLVLVVNRQ